MHHLGIDDAPHRRERVEQGVAIAGGRQPAIQHRDDAAVVPAADQATGSLREHERGGGEVDVAEAGTARPFGGFAPSLGERVVRAG